MKLHQTLALLKGATSEAHSVLTRVHHDLMKTQLLTGRRKTYQPANDDDTVTYPTEYQKVQVNAARVIAEMIPSQIRLFDVTAARDFSNTRATANVVVDGTTLIENAPVPYLLWLEKKLAEMEVFLKKVPTLNPEFHWTRNEVEGWVSDPVGTTKTKKVKTALVLHPGNDKHPPQVIANDEDVVQGYWTSVQFSGALPPATQMALLKRNRVLQDAVKVAIAEANAIESIDPKPGAVIFDYLFAGVVE